MAADASAVNDARRFGPDLETSGSTKIRQVTSELERVFAKTLCRSGRTSVRLAHRQAFRICGSDVERLNDTPGLPVRLNCMRRIGLTFFALLLALSSLAADDKLANPKIDMPGYLKIAGEAASDRQSRRLTEEEFLRMSRQPGVVILDARSAEKFCELHVHGAVNLSFPDFTAANLKQVIPDFDSPVLIYCNNNFANAEGPFPGKMAKASLNLSTYIALFTYGYRNIYELGPLLDVHSTKLTLDSCP
jgi:rhodanese-like protein